MGGSGLLALNWIFKIKDIYDVNFILHKRLVHVKNAKSFVLDLSDLSEIDKIFRIVKPDIVVNTIALTDVDLCEEKPELAKNVNRNIPVAIAKICSKYKVKLVHISTDHLFEGNRKFVSEESKPNPLNIYGKTKADAENDILQTCPDSLVIRTNFFGWGLPYRKSFSDHIIEALQNRKPLNMFYDVYFTPIFISDLIDLIHKLLDQKETGIFNVVCSDRISKYDLSKILCEHFNLDKSLIIKTSAKNYNTTVKRPQDLSLSNEKLKKTLGLKGLHLGESIENFFAEDFKKISNHDFRFLNNEYFFN
tara:strand:+ start:754 stop:1671 length:918 start_codon:yes stop_codon:yes gene_type:complete